jgi:hypothetical protein
MRSIICHTYRELKSIAAELKQMADKGFPTPEELRTTSEHLDSEIGRLIPFAMQSLRSPLIAPSTIAI